MLLTVVLCDGLQARQIDVVAGEGVQAAIDKAEPGDVVRLLKGKHNGAVTIDRAVELTGEQGAIVDGLGSGNAITVNAPDAIVRGLEVHGSGDNMPDLNSGVFVAKPPRAHASRTID